MDVRVCFFGDSFTAGVGDATGAGWVGPVAAAARGRGWDLTAYNLGVRRDTSLDVARRWRGEAGGRLRDGDRSGAVFAFGTNDVDVRFGRRRVVRDRSLALLADMLDDAHTALWPTFVVGPPPVSNPEESARAADLAIGMAEVCAARDVPFVDVTQPLATDRSWADEVDAGDACHPSTAGYQRLAAIVEPVFLQWLAGPVATNVPSLRPQRSGR